LTSVVRCSNSVLVSEPLAARKNAINPPIVSGSGFGLIAQSQGLNRALDFSNFGHIDEKSSGVA
jgi:hypothetical protein